MCGVRPLCLKEEGMRILLPLLLCVAFVPPLFAQATPGSQPCAEEERNKALVRRFYDEVWNRGNVAVVDEVFAPVYQPHDTSALRLPGAERADEQKKVAEFVRSTFSDFSLTPEFLVAEGDRVVARWTLRGKPTGLISILAAGRVETSGVNIFRFENGKGVEIWNHRDDLGARQQLGTSKLQFVSGFVLALVVCFILWLSKR